MPISINIELSDKDIERLNEAVKTSSQNADKASIDAVTAAATRLMVEADKGEVPEFIAKRLHRLDQMIAMVRDEGWAMGSEDVQRVLSALAYFVNPNDLIADSTPVLGYLDDAIMIELCERQLNPELGAYAEFCHYRHDEAERRGLDPAAVGRADWLADRRQELQDRMHRHRERGFGTGYGSSSGYASETPTFLNNAWRPSLFRTM
ncbi:MAG TPA: YkvA family protein [Xanthomonadaceae bacterium]|nr:YkvA family protein [Xanthomonadaceae bacterium]